MTADPLRLTIVTPCLDAASTIRSAIESVRRNNSPYIEHIVVDGGSADGTRDILGEYPHLDVIDARDDGPYEAINRGFARTGGDILAWLNADDFYVPNALDNVLQIFSQFDDIDWLTTQFPLCADPSGAIAHGSFTACYSQPRALHPTPSRYGPAVPAAMQQESTFWRRSLWDACGGRLNTDFHYAADYELWLRFWQRSQPAAVSAPLGCFRWTREQRSRVYEAEYRAEITKVLRLHGGRPAGAMRVLGRRAALACRGIPQWILRYCPFAEAQRVVSFDRESVRWQSSRRHGIAH